MPESNDDETGARAQDNAVSGRWRSWASACAGLRYTFSSRLSMTEKIALTTLFLILLAALAVFGSFFSDWATLNGRDLEKNLPWQGSSLTIERADGEWKSAAGDTRKSLRTAWYPAVKLRGAGEHASLLVRFSDARGKYAGDAVNLQLSNGQFSSRDTVNAVCHGNEATVSCEDGYSSHGDYMAHSLHELEPYWTATVWERLGDGTLRLLGRVTIQP